MPAANDKSVFYFSHDCNARNDEKMLALRSIYGNDGYAIYFMLIEILREQSECKLKFGKYTYNALAMQMQCDCKKLEEIITAMVNDFGLLKIEDGFIFSESLVKRVKKIEEISESRKQAAKKRWGNANSKQEESNCNANAEQMQCNKIKENKIIKNKIKKEKDICSANAAPCEGAPFADETPEQRAERIAHLRR